jgi:hypothetical protein
MPKRVHSQRLKSFAFEDPREYFPKVAYWKLGAVHGPTRIQPRHPTLGEPISTCLVKSRRKL